MQAEPKLRIDRKIQLKLLHTHEITLQRRHVSSQKKKKINRKIKREHNPAAGTLLLPLWEYQEEGKKKKKKGRFPSKQNEE